MNFKFEILFTVEFRHQYLDDALYNGFNVAPSDETQQLMKRYEMVFKARPGGFLIGYDSSFAGLPRNREALLKDNTVLSFRLNLVDLSLYNYTDHLPQDISDSIFHFRNFTIPEKPRTITDSQDKATENKLAEKDDPAGLTSRESLVQDSFVSINDIDDRPDFEKQYFSKPFGQISIFLHSKLERDFVIKFASKATYWQYILLSEHLRGLQNPAIINKLTEHAFRGPLSVNLPGNKKAIGFISEEPIALTSVPNRKFHLVENYEPGNDRQKVILSVLPNPDINQVSDIAILDAGISKNNFSTIIL